ncbi:hypothetical protein K469DRAFT_124223 [Zopfia rhizophila CBS 207.26]|uniref:RBR-type E3 ubiquitin transferase n=1 Tax=Zopfia rhizophila CBS 207.26 TaxID=1314779 RepID=A0A6A6E978_9PEZI|nr:hypothetical protein K469DRAFT_124223 [Zopfia rhizophila CBS 207.26]
MEVTSMDPATAKLAIELQLTDINEILAGLHPGPVQDDTIAAFEEMKANYQEILQVLEGQVLALNILKTEQQNRVQFNKLMEEEAQAVRDHEFACQLAGIACSTPRSSATRPTFGCSPVDTPQPAARPTFTCPPLDDFSDHEDPTMSSIFSSDPAESTRTVDFEPGARTQLNTVMRPKVTPSSSAPSKPVKDKAKEKAVEAPPRMCSACMEQYPRAEILELTCKREDEFFTHAYCHTCLIDLFESSMTDTTLFPPRCCGRKIPVYAGAHFFEPELITRYEEKEEELGVENPTYCSNRSCAVFIRPANIKADIATCKTCESKTCSICKNPLHLGLCPEDPGTKMLMDVAEERKWQRCYKCRTMVELLVGCYHMR